MWWLCVIMIDVEPHARTHRRATCLGSSSTWLSPWLPRLRFQAKHVGKVQAVCRVSVSQAAAATRRLCTRTCTRTRTHTHTHARARAHTCRHGVAGSNTNHACRAPSRRCRRRHRSRRVRFFLLRIVFVRFSINSGSVDRI